MLGMRSSSNSRSSERSRLRSALASTSSRLGIILLLQRLAKPLPATLSHGLRWAGKGRAGERSDVPALSRQPASPGARPAPHAPVADRIPAVARLAQPDRHLFLLGETLVLRRH